TFLFLIKKFNLKTPGREDDSDDNNGMENGSAGEIVAGVNISSILNGLGGKENIKSFDHCITRLRVDVNDMKIINEKILSGAGAKGVMKVGKNSVQVVIGMNVQKVFDAVLEKIRAGDTPKQESIFIITCANGKVAPPVKGKIIPRESINDETFSAGILGDGVGIEPEESEVRAPFDGTVTSVTDTKHAVGLESGGMEVLIHVGIDTVSMKGDGFECLVNEGDAVKAGQTLIKFDREKIKKAGHSDTVIVLLTNSDDLKDVKTETTK
ncbi:MAG: PTS glucose transporter subunit IIA, partial [Clostridia bacterium]|nr:PTS glucose transporter subunit IIA [Clostridia bacterium]